MHTPPLAICYTSPMQPHEALTEHFRLIKTQKAALSRLGIHTIEDLLLHFPSRYEDVTAARFICTITNDETVTVYGELTNLEKKLAWRTKRYMVVATLADPTGEIEIRWFNQPYVHKMFEHARFVKVTGKPTGTGTTRYFANPTVTPLPSIPDVFDTTTRDIEYLPIYPESRGITGKWFSRAIHTALEADVHKKISDALPERVRSAYNLPSLATALVWVHTPQEKHDADTARKRFAFEEVFAIQLTRAQQRHRVAQLAAPALHVNTDALAAFTASLPYTLTGAQERAISAIMTDLAQPYPMSRLLEGDVGSGKTAVAAATMYAVARGSVNGSEHTPPQVAYMVPTEILAKQQFTHLIDAFAHAPIPLGLITGSGCYKFPSKVNPNEPTKISRAQLTKWVANGEIPIVVGTHALIQKSVQFERLAYVIIDEQHRFGVNQRQALARKNDSAPHFLSMTATPIPRTLALTIYGDLDLSVLDERPAGRKAISTQVVPPSQRGDVHTAMRAEMTNGRQAYVICPRIDEPDPEKALALRVKSVTAEAQRLQKGAFKDKRVEMLHGKMTPDEKQEVMREFESGAIDVLVATSVVEVGVNVPNATMILIEGAERFGLSQLHQLRGRVQRSHHQPYCYLITESKTKTVLERLKTLEKATDGFALAEEDLALRGAGQLTGSSQWGLSDLGMEALQNMQMVEAARTEAAKLIREDPELAAHPESARRIAAHVATMHFE